MKFPTPLHSPFVASVVFALCPVLGRNARDTGFFLRSPEMHRPELAGPGSASDRIVVLNMALTNYLMQALILVGPFKWLWRSLTYLLWQPMRQDRLPPETEQAANHEEESTETP